MFVQAGIEELKIQGRIRVACNPLIPRLPVIAAFKVSLSLRGRGGGGLACAGGGRGHGSTGWGGGGGIGVAGPLVVKRLEPLTCNHCTVLALSSGGLTVA